MSLNLQIIDIYESFKTTTIFDDETNEEITKQEYIIQLFGNTEDNKQIYVQVENFKPYFYIKIPDNWKNNKIDDLINIVLDKSKPYTKMGLYDYEVVEKHDLYGFSDFKLFKFLKLIFSNNSAYWDFIKTFIDINLPKTLIKNKDDLKLYETNIKPFLRFLHLKNIKPCGWISVEKYNKIKYSHCELNIKCDWNSINSFESNIIQKFIICSFDIECMPEDETKFPDPENDNDIVIQIGSVFSYYGEIEPFYKNIITLNTCTKTEELKDVDIICCKTEKKVLLEWRDLIIKYNPDIITGYNINGFDFKYIHKRSIKLNIENQMSFLSKIVNKNAKFVSDSLKSSAMGKNELSYYKMERIVLDLMQYCRRNIQSDSYKLDIIASNNIKEEINNYEFYENNTILHCSNSFGINEGDYITILFFDGLTDNLYDSKYKILKINKENEVFKIIIDGIIPEDILQYKTKYWCHAKDDLKPKEMFRMQKMGPDERAIVAKYCIMDCILVTKLLEKLQVLNCSIAMSNVCYVPLSFIFMRGQSIKILSLVAKKCNELNYVIPKLKGPDRDLENEDEEKEKEKYEGAIVFPPKKGIYYGPTIVLDYASLYPSSMICYNVSHECLIMDNNMEIDETKYKIHTIDFFVQQPDGEKQKVICRFVEKLTGEKGIIPNILSELLQNRANAKNLMKNAETETLKKIYDGLQNAYKITANSVYGQLGADVGSIYLLPLAQSTTAIGRLMLNYSKKFIEGIFCDLINKAQENYEEFKTFAIEYFNQFPDRRFVAKTYKTRLEFIEYFYKRIKSILQENERVKPTIIYGDTDSVFYNPKIHNIEDGIIKNDTLKVAIEIGKLSGETICTTLPEPEKQVYEKTLYPLILLSKKRYVGNLYEDNDKEFKQKSMGIVLKRRDNSKIVKIVIGGVVNFLINERNNEGAIEYTRTILKKILRGEYGIDKFIISKTLKDKYKNRRGQAHAVLCDRIAERGEEAPAVNDRVQYVFIITNNKSKLQGDKVEAPSYVIENNLEIDYLYYIQKQIMKPCLQFLELIATNAEQVFINCIQAEENRRKGRTQIKEYFKSTQISDEEEDDDFDKLLNEEIIPEPKNNVKRKTKKQLKKLVDVSHLNIDANFTMYF